MKDRISKSWKKPNKNALNNACKEIGTKHSFISIAGIMIAILLLSSAASAAQQLQVSTSRYSVFAPYLVNTNYSFSLSGNFTAFALLLDNGLPVSGKDITFDIYANGTLKATLFNITQQNGLASVSYNMTGQFTARNDTDYGNWTITAYLAIDPAVTGSTNMSILEGGYNTGKNITTGAVVTCAHTYCHKLTLLTDANKGIGGNYPRSPFTGGYGNDTSFAEASHLRSSHSNSGRGCYFCHAGYSANNTGYGFTNDVHKNRSCDFCHGDWTYIKGNLTDPIPGGRGIPKMPGCYDCHPLFNSNVSSISTLADLLPGIDANVTGKNISVYSYNFDTKVPLTAHNGTDPGLIRSVPCVVCHGPAHNISKPDPAPENSNDITEASQCISCHGQKHATGTSCTVCHTQNAHVIQQPVTTNCVDCHSSYTTAWSSSKHNNIDAGAPTCTGCHTGYDLKHTGKIVNESNTCRNSGCHQTKDERHRSNNNSDCTQCHFANTTRPFSLNTSRSVNDHNLTIIRSFYQYNLSGAGNPFAGMPLASNGGAGTGTFPYYSCTMASCHSHSNLKIENTSQTWLQSNHARSLRYPAASDNTNSCARCKSPLNYNVSLPSSTIITAANWQGINCRVCHNLHNRSFSTGAGPIAFYNATRSSTAGYDVYDKVANATELCEKCHSGSTHDSKYAGTHKNTLNFTCVSCHMNTSTGSFNFQNHMFEVKNVTSGVTGCEVCHKEADHTFQYTSLHTGKATCEACHDKTVSRNATGYAVSSDSKTYGLYNDTATGEISSWKNSHGAPATWPLHNISKEVNCDKCHATKSAANNSAFGTLLAPDLADACMSCHPTVTSADLGLHSGFTGTSDADNGDCKTCHFGTFLMEKGAVNNSNTYFCADCHAPGSTNPKKSTSRIFTEKKHGKAACMDCHVADGIYHQDNPRGSVANLTYVNRNLSTTNTLTTECADCHLKANLNDAPFYAPGGGTHIDPTCGNGGGCHGGSTSKAAVHTTTALDNTNKKPNISVPTLDHSMVTQGTDVIILATARAANTTTANAFVDGAQYRIMSGITEVKPWTPMSAIDGDFNGSSDVATAVINTTNIPAGTYGIEVRGMAGGPSQNPLIRYYPMNGDVSPVKTAILTVQSQEGFITGIIKSGTSSLGGALVTASGASNITDPDGKYSLRLPPGTYTVTASKQPTHNSSTIPNIDVIAQQTTDAGMMTLDEKLTGTISGSVTT